MVMKISFFLLGLLCGCCVGAVFGIIILVPEYYHNAGISCMNLRNAQAWEYSCAFIKNRGGCDGNEISQADFENAKLSYWRPYGDNEEGTILDACRIRLGNNVTPEQCIQACCQQGS